MKGQTARAFEERLAPLVKRIEKLEQCYDLEGITAIAERSAEEDDILRQIHALTALATQAGSNFSRTVQKKLQSLTTRLALVPSAPRIEVIQFAQSILALKPIILVTDDTVNEEQQPELTRIFSMEPTEVPCFDYQFPPSSSDGVGLQAVEKEVMGMTGHAYVMPSIREWPHLQSVLRGRFVVAFDFPLVQLQLAVSAHRYGLPVPMLVGHSLLDLLLKYVRLKDPINDTFEQDAPPFFASQDCYALANEDVEPFIDLSVPADQRARHLLHALQAISNGTLSLQEPVLVSPIMPFAGPLTDLFSGDEA